MANKNILLWPIAFLVFTTLSFLTYRLALQFDFWKDDWYYLWCAAYQISSCSIQWLHPATPIEFIILEKLFGLKIFYWQVFGIMLRVLLAFNITILTRTITKRIYPALLSGILFSVSVIGIESVHWPSAHVVAVTAYFLSLGTIFWLKYLSKPSRRTIILASIFLMGGFLADPWRAIPMLPLLHLSLFTFANIKTKSRIQKWLLLILVMGITFLVIYGYGHRKELIHSQIGIHIINSNQIVIKLIQGAKAIGHYFNSLFNLFIGWMIPAGHESIEFSHGTFNQIFSLISIILLILGAMILRLVHQYKSRVVRLILFFIAWILLFHLPTWFYDPRLIVTEVHRYQTIPSIGMFVISGILLGKIRYKLLSLLLVLLFMVINFQASQKALFSIYFFRSAVLVESIWDKIITAADQDKNKIILVLRGQDPMKTNMFLYFGAYTFGIKQKISKQEALPIAIEGDNSILEKLCQRYQPIPLNSVYAWYVSNNGNVDNQSQIERNHLASLLSKQTCNDSTNESVEKRK